MHTGEIRAMVFDFDGTLAELTIDFPAMKRAVAQLVATYIPGTRPALDIPVLEWLETQAGALRRQDPDLADELLHRAHASIHDVEMEAAQRGRLFDFTRPILAELPRRGVCTAIITRNSRQAVQTVFPDILDHTDVLLAREDVDNVKPHPEHMGKALAVLGIEPVHALMTGDHMLDIQTGTRAGTASAGVLTGNADDASLRAEGADWVAPDCRELIRMLDDEGFLPGAS